jgi:redox-sensitive bicupin YhaK (pirin superfamily)
MILLRRSADRGQADLGWLKSFHTFSFGDYYDPAHESFGPLRVINEDFISGGGGFSTHGHRDMEIITYLVNGALAHKDSLGNAATILPGEVQHMSAGTGVRHSEYNPNADVPAHLLQIWILPNQANLKPSYGQKTFSPELKKGEMTLLISQSGKNGSVPIHQDADIYALKSSHAGNFELSHLEKRHVWVQVISGSVLLNGVELNAGDGAGLTEEPHLELKWSPKSELLLFNMS